MCISNSPAVRTGVQCLAAMIILKDILVFAYYVSTVSVTDDMEWAKEEDNSKISKTIALLQICKDDKSCSATIKLVIFYLAVYILIIVDAVMALILYKGVSRDKLADLQAWSKFAAGVFVCSGVFLVVALLKDVTTVYLWFFGISFVLYSCTLYLVAVIEEELKLQIPAQLVQQNMNAGNENEVVGRCPAQVVNRPLYPKIV